MKMLLWPLMGELLHLVQRGGAWAQGPGRPPRPFLAVPNVTAHPSTARVSLTVLLYNGPLDLLCGFNVPVKWLKLINSRYLKIIVNNVVWITVMRWSGRRPRRSVVQRNRIFVILCHRAGVVKHKSHTNTKATPTTKFLIRPVNVLIFCHFCRVMLYMRSLCRHAVSVRPSVTFVDSVKTNKHVFKLFHFTIG